MHDKVRALWLADLKVENTFCSFDHIFEILVV